MTATYAEDRELYRDLSTDWLYRIMEDPETTDDTRIVIEDILEERDD